MGMSISGVLVVGLPFDEVCEDIDDFCENYEDSFECISPYYDADDSDCVIGFVVARGYYTFNEITDEDIAFIPSLKAAFKENTGKEAKLYVMPWVS